MRKAIGSKIFVSCPMIFSWVALLWRGYFRLKPSKLPKHKKDRSQLILAWPLPNALERGGLVPMRKQYLLTIRKALRIRLESNLYVPGFFLHPGF